MDIKTTKNIHDADSSFLANVSIKLRRARVIVL